MLVLLLSLLNILINFFDCLNVDNLNEGTRTKKKFQEPYNVKNDFRLKVHYCYRYKDLYTTF